jgi:cyanophycinase-like exopeptidase
MAGSGGARVSDQPGLILLLGSGETAPSAQKIYHWLFSRIREQTGDGIRAAILETPAGFEPNSAAVAGQVGAYIQKRLQNFRPSVQIVPARKQGTAHSPDDPTLAAMLHDANAIFLGPGSPTYAARQLRGSLVWETLRACHRAGAVLILASAATLAVSRYTMPVYEIYKVGEDVHWKPGLDFFGDFGFSTVFVSHWNNRDGGEALDTSRCYLGEQRFGQLVQMLPGGLAENTVVGIDENTALVVDPASRSWQVMGPGHVTIQGQHGTALYSTGVIRPMSDFGAFVLPTPIERGITPVVWQDMLAGRAASKHVRAAQLHPSAAVLALFAARQAARATRDWAASDHLRDELSAQGWQVLDTTEGQVLNPLTIGN